VRAFFEAAGALRDSIRVAENGIVFLPPREGVVSFAWQNLPTIFNTAMKTPLCGGSSLVWKFIISASLRLVLQSMAAGA
jgi:hypothetical protein